MQKRTLTQRRPTRLARRAPTTSAVRDALYTTQNAQDRQYISTGSGLLNCVVSGQYNGGYVLGQMVNIVGDKSTGKTLLAIESCANFHIRYPEGRIRYCEAESAFDEPYAESVGLPSRIVEFPNSVEPEPVKKQTKRRRTEWDSDESDDEETASSAKARAKRKGKTSVIETVEDFFDDINKFADEQIKAKQPGLYIVDSLDALSADAELDRDMSDGTYGMEKQKLMSQIFRRVVRKLGRAQVALFIISQVRANVNARFGRKWTRNGGKALDFYASQILWLAEIKKLYKTRRHEKRATGILVAGYCDKNKVAPPFRTCDFPIVFSYGLDDVKAEYDWLKERFPSDFKRLTGYAKVLPAMKTWDGMTRDEQREHRAELGALVQDRWAEMETEFLPERKPKYG